MSAGVLLLVGTILVAFGGAIYIQIVRLDRLLENKYPKDYAPFQNSIWGDDTFSPVMRFIKSGRYTDYNDPELEKLCRSVQKLFNIEVGLCSILAIIFLLINAVRS